MIKFIYFITALSAIAFFVKVVKADLASMKKEKNVRRKND